MTDRVPVTLARKALEASVPKTSVELVDGGTMRDRIAGIVPVHQVAVRHTHFTSVFGPCGYDRSWQDGVVAVGVLARLTISGL